jgi:hypothetical protein
MLRGWQGAVNRRLQPLLVAVSDLWQKELPIGDAGGLSGVANEGVIFILAKWVIGKLSLSGGGEGMTSHIPCWHRGHFLGTVDPPRWMPHFQFQSA